MEGTLYVLGMCISITEIRGGRYGKNIISHLFIFISRFHNFITIHCHVGLTILSEQCRQTNVPIIKTKPFKVTNIKNMVDI